MITQQFFVLIVKKIHVLCTGGINFYIENELNIGLTRSLNKALPLISSEYILRCDADDLSLIIDFGVSIFTWSPIKMFLTIRTVVYSFNRPYTTSTKPKFHYSLCQPYPHSFGLLDQVF